MCLFKNIKPKLQNFPFGTWQNINMNNNENHLKKIIFKKINKTVGNSCLFYLLLSFFVFLKIKKKIKFG